jgi:glutamine synthetase
MQRHLPSVIALLAPYVNSYRRYVRDFAAPINLEWGRDNRTTGLRVPVSDAARAGSRTACRGWTATPISASPPRSPAAIWGWSIRSTRRRPSPAMPMPAATTSRRGSTARWSSSVPTRHRGRSRAGVLPVYTAVKSLEYSEFLQVISPWEREHLLMNV